MATPAKILIGVECDNVLQKSVLATTFEFGTVAFSSLVLMQHRCEQTRRTTAISFSTRFAHPNAIENFLDIGTEVLTLFNTEFSSGFAQWEV